jgi:hypothetical protein
MVDLVRIPLEPFWRRDRSRGRKREPGSFVMWRSQAE